MMQKLSTMALCAGDDTIQGGDADQTFITLGGHDKIDGGWGYDTLKIDELSENQ